MVHSHVIMNRGMDSQAGVWQITAVKEGNLKEVSASTIQITISAASVLAAVHPTAVRSFTVHFISAK